MPSSSLQPAWGLSPLRQHAAGVHQRDAVAAPGPLPMKCVEMKITTVLASSTSSAQNWSRHRIDAGGRPVEDQQLGLVDHRDGQATGAGGCRAAGRRRLPAYSYPARSVHQLWRSTRADAVAAGRWNSRACRSRFCCTVARRRARSLRHVADPAPRIQSRASTAAETAGRTRRRRQQAG